MVYIVVVNPKILEAAGIPFGPSMVATILSAFFGTLAMGIYAKRPFAIAPYMGENAFVAFTVVELDGILLANRSRGCLLGRSALRDPHLRRGKGTAFPCLA